LEICLSGEKKGNYYGILLIQSKEEPVGIGVWIKVSLMENKTIENFSLTGKIVSQYDYEKKVITLFMGITIILFLILLFFLLKLSKSKKK